MASIASYNMSQDCYVDDRNRERYMAQQIYADMARKGYPPWECDERVRRELDYMRRGENTNYSVNPWPLSKESVKDKPKAKKEETNLLLLLVDECTP